MKKKINGSVGHSKASSLKLMTPSAVMKKQPSAPADAGDVSIHCCSECRKEFRSCKAVYGHMRSHTDRGSKNPVAITVGPPLINGVVGCSRASSLRLKIPKDGMKKKPLIPANAGDVSCHRRSKRGRMFKSRRAVYGHGRCHTDRCSFKNLVSVTAGPSSVNPMLGNAVAFSSDELGAAEALLMLANGPSL